MVRFWIHNLKIELMELSGGLAVRVQEKDIKVTPRFLARVSE